MINISEIIDSEVKAGIKDIAFFNFSTEVMNKSNLFGLKTGDVVELKEPFLIGGQNFKFNNRITTDDWLIIVNSYQTAMFKAMINGNNMGTMTSNEAPIDPSAIIQEVGLLVDIIQGMSFKYLIHVDKDTGAELKVEKDNLNDLINYSPEVVLIPRKFFQKILFIISKSSLYT